MEMSERYRILYETMTTGIIFYDQKGRITFANPAAEKILGISFNIIRGFNNPEQYSMFIDEDGMVLPEGNHPAVIALRENKPVRNVVLGFLHPAEGCLRWIEVNATPFFNHDGISTGAYINFNDITLYKKEMDELREGQIRYRQIVKGAPLGIVVCDTHGNIKIVNDTLLKILGSPSEKETKKINMFNFHPLVEAGIAGIFLKCLESGETLVSEHSYVTKWGKTTYLRFHLTPIMDPAGARIGLQALIEDFTVQRSMQEALHNANRRLYDIIEFLPDATFVVDKNNIVIAWNQAMEKLIGIKKEDALGRDSRDETLLLGGDREFLVNLYFDENAKTAFHLYDVLNGEGNAILVEGFVPQLFNGKGAYLRAKVRPFYNDSGEMVGAIETIADITSQRLAEEALKKSEKQLRLITDNMVDVVYQYDNSMLCRYASPSNEAALGYRPDSLVNAAINELVHPDDAKELYEKTKDTFASNSSSKTELRILHADGSYIWFEAAIKPIFDQSGGVDGFVVSARDITARKRVEEDLKKARAGAESANRAKSQFLAQMSHEIRTPVNAIMAMAELLQFDDDLTPRQHEFASIIYDSGQILLDIINDILDLSRIEAGKLILESVELDPVSLVENVSRLMSIKAREKNLELKTDIGNGIPAILRGDTVRLRQVLFNLIGNAIKFTEQGGVVISVAAVSCGKDHVTIRFAVADTGIGISSARYEELFQPFTQLDSNTTRKYGGTGLGLTISKRLVHLMGGEIGVESEHGKGSTFWFTVALGKIPALSTAREGYSGRDDPGKTPGPDFQATKTAIQVAQPHWRILVAEDNPINRKVAEFQLEKLGCQYLAVEDGSKAVEAALGGSWDLILMDCQMPVMDGCEATRMIRKAESCKGNHVPIIAMTALVMSGDRENCIAAGMDDYLSKPFNFKELGKILKKWLPSGM